MSDSSRQRPSEARGETFLAMALLWAIPVFAFVYALTRM